MPQSLNLQLRLVDIKPLEKAVSGVSISNTFETILCLLMTYTHKTSSPHLAFKLELEIITIFSPWDSFKSILALLPISQFLL